MRSPSGGGSAFWGAAGLLMLGILLLINREQEMARSALDPDARWLRLALLVVVAITLTLAIRFLAASLAVTIVSLLGLLNSGFGFRGKEFIGTDHVDLWWIVRTLGYSSMAFVIAGAALATLAGHLLRRRAAAPETERVPPEES